MFEAVLAELGAWSPPGDRGSLRSAGVALAKVRAAVDAAEARLAAVISEHVVDAASELRGITRCSKRTAERVASRGAALAAVPELGDKLAAGETSAEHVDALVRAVEETSAAAVAASSLVDLATKASPEQLAGAARRFVRNEQSEADKAVTRRRQRAKRRADWFRGDGGMWVLHAEFDPDAARHLQASLDGAVNRFFHADGGRGVAADRRTGAQRRADALEFLLTRTGAVDELSLPSVRSQAMVVITADGAYDAESGLAVAGAEAERLACVSDLFGLVLDGRGEPLWHGRRKRRATDVQVRALKVRDGGCVICAARPSLCEAHHVVHWDGPGKGGTDIDNLALLCRYHHHYLHDHGLVLARTADGRWEMRGPP